MLFSGGLFSQTFWNNASVYISNQTSTTQPGVTPTLFVSGDIEIAQDPSNTVDGVFKNDGEIELTGNWISRVPMAIDSVLDGDVTFSYSSDNGGLQSIQGIPTYFWRLNLNNNIVELFAPYTYVQKRLDLMSTRLETHQNKIHILNPQPDQDLVANAPNAAIWYDGGYVSTDTLQGGLVRSMNSNAMYRFPVGSQNLNYNYRALDIWQKTTDSSDYMVAIRGINATNENTNMLSFSGLLAPYPISDKELLLFEVTDKYFITLDRPYTDLPSSTAQVRLNYYKDDNRKDRSYTYKNMARWSSSNSQWERTDFVHDKFYSGPSHLNNPDYSLTSANVGNFGEDIFAIGVNDGPPVFIPQIFSPNGDGLNDELFVYGNRFNSISFVVFDRWGEKVFETTDVNQGWDGTFKGTKAQQGVYVYYLEADVKKIGKITQKGNVTLVR